MEIVQVIKKNQKQIIRQLVRFIKEGKIIVCPTDTVYGFLADATDKKAVERVFKIKKRPKNKAVPIFIKDIKSAKKLAFIDKEQEKFLKKNWPGKITVVLKARRNLGLPKLLFEKNRIGLRIPDYKLVNQLLKKLNRPLTATSANISGNPASTRIRKILKQFKDQKIQPDLVLDAGNLPESKPSKVIDLTKNKPKILRK